MKAEESTTSSGATPAASAQDEASALIWGSKERKEGRRARRFSMSNGEIKVGRPSRNRRGERSGSKLRSRRSSQAFGPAQLRVMGFTAVIVNVRAGAVPVSERTPAGDADRSLPHLSPRIAPVGIFFFVWWPRQ